METAHTPETPRNLVQLSIPTPDSKESDSAMTMVAYAEQFAIETTSDSAKAQEARARINTRIKTMTESRLIMTRPLDAAKKTIMDWWNAPISALERAKVIFDKKIIAYDTEQDRLRRLEQQRQEEIAAKERRRLQAIAEEATRKANAEAAEKRRLATVAEQEGRAADAAKLAAQATRVEEKAEAKAEQFETRAAAVVAPIIQSEAPKVTGTSLRENWTFRITDPTKINAAFLMPDEAKIGKLVKSMKGDAAALIGAGIEVFSEKILASRRA